MKSNRIVNGARLSAEDFAKTIPEFGIMPFWFVNGRMDYDEMEYQLKEYKAKGVPGIYFHSRFGTLENIGYLTDDWFDRVKFAIKKAREIGLQIWIYDEYNWPSGTAGKQVMQHDQKLTQRYLELVEVTVAGQYFSFMEGTDSRYNDLEESEPVYACAILEKNLDEKNFEYVDLMPNIVFDKVISWEAPKGPWRQMYFIERKANWYADVLNEEATDMFLKLTHERYKQELEKNGDKIENCIHGFYTDEPGMHYFEVFRNNYIIPWSRQMFKIFQDRNGYSLLHNLPKLFHDFGGDTAQVRYDFWHALSDQYEHSYYQKIQNFCEENNLVFTGHLMCEEWPRLQARTNGNLFHQLRHMGMTGVDHLYPRVGTREMPDEHVALKLASSAAHQFGSTRLLCESLGGSYWDCTMERMKWIADWEYVLGVNLLNPHGFHYTIEGERKRDWPPSMFYHHTWWPQYKLFNDYVSRMSYLLSGGHHIAKVAIVYPINTIWSQYEPQESNDITQLILRDFEYLTDRMLRLHIDFDYLDEDVMCDDCNLQNGKLTIRGEEYECLILPALTHIKAKTLNTLEKFVSLGGSVIVDSLLPVASIEGQQDAEDFNNRITKLFGYRADKVLAAFRSGKVNFGLNKISDKVYFVQGEGFCKGDHFTELESVLRNCVESEIYIDSDEVFYLHRVKDKEHFFFLVNPTHNCISTRVKIRGEWTLERWDLETGNIESLYPYRYEDGFTCFNWTFFNVGSIMLHAKTRENCWINSTNLTIAAFTDTNIVAYGNPVDKAYVDIGESNGIRHFEALSNRTPVEFVPSDDWKIKFSAPNVLIINNWKTTFDDDAYTPEALSDSNFNFENFMDFHMGTWALQLPFEREEETYPVDLLYVTRFNCKYCPDDLKMMIDGFRCKKYEVYLNGIRIEETPVRSYLDAEINTIPLRNIHLGENTIVVRMQVCSKNAGILDLLKIIGTFSVEADENGEYIARPMEKLHYGDWCKQGYPYLAAIVDYTQKITLPEGMLGSELIFSADIGDDLYEVLINGKKVDTRMWQPYESDLTRAIEENTFTLTIRVINTVANILEAQRKPSGLNSCNITAYPIYHFDLL